VRMKWHSEYVYRKRFRPKNEDGLGPKPILLGPPETDPVIPSKHLPCDLAVMGLPRIPESKRSQERQVEHRGCDEDQKHRTPKRAWNEYEERKKDDPWQT